MLIDTTQLALERSISGAAQRHEALAANIANAATPGYRRVDVDFHGALAAALGSSTKSAVEHTASRPRPMPRSASRRPTATRSTSTTSRPSSPPTRSSSRPPCRSRRPATRSCAPRIGCRLMSMFGGMEISASALTAQRLRMNVTAENLANAETTKGADGNPYRRKEVVAAVGRPGRQLRLAALRAPWAPAGVAPGGVQAAADHRGPDQRQARRTTRATPTPTRRATSACRTSTRSPRWST